jgi:hypothetical protein
MSYDITLTNAGPVERFQESGTQAVGGTTEPELNVTYNYAEVFSLFDWSINDLHGKRAADTTEKLEEIHRKLSVYRPYEKDYWAPTPGNCFKVINRLLLWARQYPNGIWSVS